MKRKETSTSNPRSNTREDDDQKAEANRRAAESSRAVAEPSRGSAEEGRERREQDDKSRQVVKAGADSQRGLISNLEKIFHNPTEVQLQVLRQAIEQSNEAIIIATGKLDLSGPLIVYVSPAFTKMTGYAPEDVIGKTPRILRGPKTDQSVISRLREDIAAGKVFHGEMI